LTGGTRTDQRLVCAEDRAVGVLESRALVIVPRRYPVEFRRKVLDLIEAGKPVVEIAAQLGVSDQTIYTWRNQDRIDRGLRAGVTTAESAELTAARKRIRELETELAVTKRANELLKEQTDPKGAGRSSPRS
jgi:transposase-like protein